MNAIEQEIISKNKPAFTDFRGRLKLTIWPNETDQGIRYSSEITRTWKDGEDYHSTSRLDENDLLAAAKLAHVADDWVSVQRKNDRAA